MSFFKGTFPALITPFRDGDVDEQALRDLVERQIQGGVSGLVPCGTTGENVALDDGEFAQVVRITVEQSKGRVPVVAGSGTNATRKSLKLSSIAKELGVDGIMLVCPYYNRPSPAGVAAHFRTVAEAVALPTMLYNIPGRTGIDMMPDTLAALADLPHVMAVKEATGNVVRAQEIARRFGDRFSVLSGDDALTVGMMAVGAKGVVSVCSNVAPAEVSAVTTAALAGDFKKALELHQRLLPLHAALFIDSNPGPVKALLAHAGHIAPNVRGPLAWPGDDVVARVVAAAAEAGVKV